MIHPADPNCSTFPGAKFGPGAERECWMPDFEGTWDCPECGVRMTCANDYGSGSNHYWTLVCAGHGRFTKSTYRHGGFDGSIPRPWL